MNALVKKVWWCCCTVGVIFVSGFAQQETPKPKLLFVYDTLDEKSSFFITTFREELKKAPFTVEEAAVETTIKTDLSAYDAVVLYSRVMAFDMKSPVRTWVENQKTFVKKRLYLMATANRWFLEKHFTKLKTLLEKREGVLVDAVSMATKEMSDDEKRKKVREFVAGIGKE